MGYLNTALEIAIIQSEHKRDYRVARLAKIHPTRFSAIKNNRLPANAREKQAIAEVLGRDVAELFPEAVAK